MEQEPLTEQARATGYSRSAIIRSALDGVQVLQAAPTAEQREHYRQLVKLATNLNQLVVQAYGGAFASLEKARLEIAYCLDTYFNLDRCHLALGYRSPIRS